MRDIAELTAKELTRLANGRTAFDEATRIWKQMITDTLGEGYTLGNGPVVEGKDFKVVGHARKKRRKMSAQARANIAAGVRRRWAKLGYPQK